MPHQMFSKKDAKIYKENIISEANYKLRAILIALRKGKKIKIHMRLEFSEQKKSY